MAISIGRFVLAVVAVLTMWLVAVIALFVGLLSESCVPDSDGPECDETFSWVALGIAGVLYLASAPVGYLIAGRRWMFLAPLVPIVASLASIAVDTWS